jgi:hypothetical protein
MRVAIFPHPRQHLLLVVFLRVAILTEVRWNHKVLICISSMPSMVIISSCAFWPFGLFPFKKLCSVHLPISSLGHWFLGEFDFLSSHSVGYTFNQVTISFVVQNFLSHITWCCEICIYSIMVRSSFLTWIMSHAYHLLWKEHLKSTLLVITKNI